MADDTRPVPNVSVSARGVVTDLETHANSRGEPWVTITVATTGGPLSGVCFPRSLRRLATPLTVGAPIVIHGQISSDGADFRIVDAVDDTARHST